MIHNREWRTVIRFPDNLSSRTFLIWLLLLIAAIKGTLLLIDHTPSLLLGDSQAYLATASANYIPTDRSFTYGLFLRLVAVWPHSLLCTVIFQSALSTISAWIIAIILIRYFKTGFAVAGLCSLLSAVEPLQLLSERYVLTEALSTFLFAVLVLVAFHYVWTRDVIWLALTQVIGVALTTIRVSFLPIAVLLSLVLPLMTERTRRLIRNLWRSGFTGRGLKRLQLQLLMPLLLAFLLSRTLLSAYKDWYGSLMTPAQRGALLYADGFFLASVLAPIIHPSDYPIADQRDAIFNHLGFPLQNERDRNIQRWSDEGLCALINKVSGGDPFAANKLARKTALRAVKRDPLGPIRLATLTFLDYFDLSYLRELTALDEGQGRQISPEFARDLKKFVGTNMTEPYVDSWVKRWHRFCEPWYLFLLFLPILFLVHAVIYRRQSMPYHWLCATFALIFFFGVTIPVVGPDPRYMTGLAWLSFVIAGAVWSDVQSRSLAGAGFFLRRPALPRVAAILSRRHVE